MLRGLPSVIASQQALVHGRIMVASEADVPHLALLFGLYESFERAMGAKYLVHFGLGAHLVALPQVQVVRAHAPEALFKLAHGLVAAAQVGLGHQQDLLAPPALERLAVSDLALAVVIQVRAVKHVDAQIHGPVDDADPLILAAYAHMVAAQRHAADVQTAFAER